MGNYKVKARTNGWIASRDSMFNGKREVTLQGGLSMREAQRRLLDIFNEMFAGELFATNWGMAVLMTKKSVFGAVPTFNDGTRSFTYDSREFFIEQDEEGGAND